MLSGVVSQLLGGGRMESSGIRHLELLTNVQKISADLRQAKLKQRREQVWETGTQI